MTSKIIQQGAEAIISLKDNQIIKNRIKKSYRLSVLDEKLRKSRTKREAKLLEKASSLISVPSVFSTDNKEKIKMQFIKGKKLSEWLDKLSESEKICKEIGKQVAILHDNDIIHGDLTTSNMIYVENVNNTHNKKPKTSKSYKELINIEKNNISSVASIHQTNSTNKLNSRERASESSFKVFFIDFGLGFHSKRIEDKAVDLHLLRQALEAKHFLNWKKLFSAVLKEYKSKSKTKVLEQLKKVESRGRYKKH